MDGTHIPAHVPEGQQTPYCNRKNQLSQNVLVACDFDLQFVYVLPGWEGSAADSRIYEDARASDFSVPDGRYYLGDGGYANSASLLVPYWSTRYHLKEWGQSRHRCVPYALSVPWLLIPSSHNSLQNYKELFNYRHAQLRNHVERIFGLFKRRFQVLMRVLEYSLDMQARLVPALAVLHNFVHIHNPTDLLQDDNNVNNQDHPFGNPDDGPRHHAAGVRDAAAAFRDGIALHMWQDYQNSDRRQA